MASEVSVIVPAYNAEGEIADCLQSLASLDYPKKKVEIIIVDNNSDDSTADIVKAYPVTYVFEGRRGSYCARNAGIRKSSGRLVAFTDADCVVDREWLKRILKPFSNPKVAVVGGRIAAYHPITLVERYCALKAFPQEKFLSRPIPFAATANAAFRRKILEDVGLFDGSFTSGGDEEVCWRIKQKGYTVAYEKDAVVYHKHRKTLAELFALYVKYGKGQSRLYKKYGRSQIDLSGYGAIALNIAVRTPWRLFTCWTAQDKSLYAATPLCDAVAIAGFKTGSIIGSMRNKVVFI